jgi:cytochrome c553
VALSPWAIRCVLEQRESNALLRGSHLAVENGCLGCHLPPGNREIPNARSQWGSVPRFGGGSASLYATSRREIEEFIRFGALRSWLEDPTIAATLEAQLVRMPAYGERLSDAEIADLTAWVGAVEAIELLGDEAAKLGRNLASKHGCVACHGVEGAGGIENPGSLGGFVPGFAGGNFTDLVRDEAEFRQWVETGTLERLGGSRFIRYFWTRQRLQMPAYEELLSEEEIGQLWAWVEAVRGTG